MKTFWTVLTTVLVMVVLGLGVYYFAVLRPGMNKKSENITIIDNEGVKPSTAKDGSSDATDKKVELKKPAITDWSKPKTYSDPILGFKFNYPSNITFNGTKLGDAPIALDVVVKKISELDAPLGNDSATAKKDLAALEKNIPTTAMDFALPQSYQMLTGSNLVGKTYVVLGQLQVCDVQLKKTAVLYNGQYQIKISLSFNDIDYIRSANPDYFVSDSTNCGTGKIWKSQDDFYKALQGGKTDDVSQDFLNAFKRMMVSYGY